jgi:hypothetical protein
MRRELILRLFVSLFIALFGCVIEANIAAASSVPDKVADLNTRAMYWKTQLPYCNWDGGARFPSKYGDADGPDNESLKCNDGDSVGFNGVLCASGDSEACDAVKRSQDLLNGRWWRSPRRLHNPVAEGGSETTFSNDHALGVWSYIAQTKDKDAFRAWIKWIAGLPRCGTSLQCIPSLPMYCADDRCGFKLIDCPMLDRLALVLLESNPICDPLHDFSNSAFLIVTEFQNQFNEVIEGIYRLPGAQLARPAIEPFRAQFIVALTALREALKRSQSLRELMATFARAGSGTDGLAAAVNSMVNAPGYSLDDVAIAIFNLRKYGGFNGPALSSAAEILVARESQNAFFEYVAHGPTETMLNQILAKCSSQENDIAHARFQWIWQRDDKEQPPPSKKTMYWDCIFVANLYKNGPLPSIDLPAPPFLGEAYKLAMKEVDDAQQLYYRF